MAEFMTAQLAIVSPYRLWDTQVYFDIEGSNNHEIICYDCFTFFHFQNKYDVAISSLLNDTSANQTVVFDSSIADKSNHGGKAIDIARDIWNSMCVMGVHVIHRDSGENTEWTYGDRGRFQVGTQWTIIVWAVEGHCMSMHDPEAQLEGTIHSSVRYY